MLGRALRRRALDVPDRACGPRRLRAPGAPLSSPSVGAQDRDGRGAWEREPRTQVRQAAEATQSLPASVVILAGSEVAGPPTEWEPHSHPMHELVWVRGGTLTSRVRDRVLTVSRGHGLWLPAGQTHAGRVTGGAELCDAFFAPDRTPLAFDRPTMIAMTPLLESLLTHLARTDLGPAERERAEAVVFDVLEPVEHELSVQVPGDARIDVIARTLLDDPADDRGLDAWARHLGVSERTITRAFRTATGLSFVQWRQVLRVHHALTLMVDGHDVQDTSELLGYAQPSTFIAAFRRVMGMTPGAFREASA